MFVIDCCVSTLAPAVSRKKMGKKRGAAAAPHQRRKRKKTAAGLGTEKADVDRGDADGQQEEAPDEAAYDDGDNVASSAQSPDPSNVDWVVAFKPEGQSKAKMSKKKKDGEVGSIRHRREPPERLPAASQQHRHSGSHPDDLIGSDVSSTRDHQQQRAAAADDADNRRRRSGKYLEDIKNIIILELYRVINFNSLYLIFVKLFTSYHNYDSKCKKIITEMFSCAV